MNVESRFAYLEAFSAPIASALASEDVTDIYINRPGEYWVETIKGEQDRVECAALDGRALDRLARQIAAASGQGVGPTFPLLSASLPDGTRVQVVSSEVTSGSAAFAFRRQAIAEMRLDDYSALGLIEEQPAGASADANREIRDLLGQGRHIDALRLAVQSRKNILVSGGTSSGKTTLLNALIREIPPHERLISIEDTPEIQCPHDNSIGLIASRSKSDAAGIDMEDLLTATLRLRPDRILLGELRGSEAFSFLRAINSGHPGSISTIHANCPESAVEQLALLIAQGTSRLSREDVVHYVRTSIELHVQLEKRGGKRVITKIAMRDQDSPRTA